MPTPSETISHIKTRAWQAIAQSEIDVSQVPKEELDKLIAVIADAAVMEMDFELGQALNNELGRGLDTELGAEPGKELDQEDGRLPTEEEIIAALNNDQEVVLWEGRPFLSIRTRYVVTNQRVRIIEGLLGKEREDIEMVRIQDLDQKQTLRERMFNLGDIILRTHDRGRPVAILNNVRDPETVHEIIRRGVLKAREKYRLTFQEEM
jgi:hypothetical protein